MENCSLCDVLIELVDRYITEKQNRLRYCSELEKANARLEQYEEQIVSLKCDIADFNSSEPVEHIIRVERGDSETVFRELNEDEKIAFHQDYAKEVLEQQERDENGH